MEKISRKAMTEIAIGIGRIVEDHSVAELSEKEKQEKLECVFKQHYSKETSERLASLVVESYVNDNPEAKIELFGLMTESLSENE